MSDLDEKAVEDIAIELILIFQREREVRAGREPARSGPSPLDLLPFATIDEIDLTTLPEPVDFTTVEDGLEYAATCIGLVLIHSGGIALMQRVIEAAERFVGGPDAGKIASWLDHRWNDLANRRGERWVS